MVVTDALGRTVTVPDQPATIISLVPSLTQLLYTLGLDAAVKGITKFCVHPQHWHQTKMRIGGTKNPSIEKIKGLRPQLIIASKEENRWEDVQALAQTAPVYVTDITDVASALKTIKNLAAITGKREAGNALCEDVRSAFAALPPFSLLSAVYLIWQEPIMTVGGDTFIHSMMQHCGFQNLFSGENRYPQITIEWLQTQAPQVLLLSSEPYPFKQKHVAAYQRLLPQTKVVLADGEMFSWYGSRMLAAPDYFKSLRAGLDSINL